MSSGSPSPYQQPQIAPTSANNTSVVKILLIVGGAVFLMMLLCGGVLLAMLIPAVDAARQAAARAQTSNQLKVIGISLHNYHASYGSLPPAYLTDANGKPTLSWRVLILPFLDDQNRYDRFDLTQAWDSPANLELARNRPDIYGKPTDDELPADRTYILAIRSPQSIFPDQTPVSFKSIADGTAATVALVESPNQSVVWTAPDDSTPAEFIAGFKASKAPVQLLFTDAVVKSLKPNELDEATINAIITRDGGETVNLP